jgi:hypothetical protein
MVSLVIFPVLNLTVTFIEFYKYFAMHTSLLRKSKYCRNVGLGSQNIVLWWPWDDMFSIDFISLS